MRNFVRALQNFRFMHVAPRCSPRAGRRIALSVGAGALAVAAGALLSGQLAGQHTDDLTLYREIEMHVARVPASSLSELTSQSDAVIVGRVSSRKETHVQAIESVSPRRAPTRALPTNIPTEQAAALANARASAPEDGLVRPPAGIPMTTYSVEVSRVLKGNLAIGARIDVTQPGGDVQIPLGPGRPTLQRRIVAEHDPPLVPGQEQLLFLHRGDGGQYSISGGADGRFSLDARRTLQPVDEGSVVGKAHRGKTLEQLEEALGRQR